jgi:hypothetical protein
MGQSVAQALRMFVHNQGRDSLVLSTYWGLLEMANPNLSTAEPKYVPSPEEIRAATAEIRKSWSESQEQRRKGYDERPFVKFTNRGRKRWNGHLLAPNYQVLDDIIDLEQAQLAFSLSSNPENCGPSHGLPAPVSR